MAGGVIQSDDEDTDDRAIKSEADGGTTIDNHGTIVGRVELSEGQRHLQQHERQQLEYLRREQVFWR